MKIIFQSVICLTFFTFYVKMTEVRRNYKVFGIILKIYRNSDINLNI